MFAPNLENIKFAWANSSNVTTRSIIPFGLCKVFEGYPQKFSEHAIEINGNGKAKYQVFITDSMATPKYLLPKYLSEGEHINLEHEPMLERAADYNIKLKETTVASGDESCSVYPTEIHASYADCIKEENEEMVLPLLGCMVPWLSDKNPCQGPLLRLPRHDELFKILKKICQVGWAGYQYASASCLPPCTTLTAIPRNKNLFTVFHLSRKNHIYINGLKIIPIKALKYCHF